jgi:hypothetical protein
MTTVFMLMAALVAQDTSAQHVRATEPRIAAVIAAGLSQSETFRRLIDVLDRSDVIVYVEPKLTRQALGAYLAHNVVVGGAFRYLHVAIDVHGANGRIVPLLAHELQHAVEVAQDPAARDAHTVDQLFNRLAIEFGCGGSACSETQAAKDVEATVVGELKRSR